MGRGAVVNILDIEHLRCSFGSLVVTDDVNLSIAPGERHVVIGPNGAGKTSLINQIGGPISVPAPPSMVMMRMSPDAVQYNASDEMKPLKMA